MPEQVNVITNSIYHPAILCSFLYAYMCSYTAGDFIFRYNRRDLVIFVTIFTESLVIHGHDRLITLVLHCTVRVFFSSGLYTDRTP